MKSRTSMKMSDDWYRLFEQLHRIVQSDLQINRGRVNWSHYGRCMSSLLHKPAGISGYQQWRVCGVTPKALDQIVRYGDNKGIQRGHIVSQLELARCLFESSVLPTKEIFEAAIGTYDITVLMTKEENDHMATKARSKSDDGISRSEPVFEYYSFDDFVDCQSIDGYFKTTYRGYTFRKMHELTYLSKVHASRNDIVKQTSSDVLSKFKTDRQKWQSGVMRLPSNQPMGLLLRAEGQCDDCGCEFGANDFSQTVAVWCTGCLEKKRVCSKCKAKGCNCGNGGQYRNTFDDSPGLLH